MVSYRSAFRTWRWRHRVRTLLQLDDVLEEHDLGSRTV